MRFRPGTPLTAGALQAEGLLVVDPGTGEPARRYAPLDPVDVPTLRATARAARSWSAPPGRSASRCIPAGGEAALQAFGDEYAAGRQVLPLADPPTVWCSWYHYFEQVTAADIAENLRAIDELDLPVDVVQIDDGWSPGLGEGLVPAPELRVAARAGRRDPRLGPTGRAVAGAVPGRDADHAGPGAPRLAGGSGRPQLGPGPRRPGPHPPRRAGPAARRARSAGGTRAWTTSSSTSSTAVRCPAPGTRTWTRWRPTAPGWRWSARRSAPTSTSWAAARRCCPSVGLVDAMRVSPDTFHEGAEDGSAGLRGLMPLAARAWMQGRLWVNDPDCVVARPSYRLRERWATEAAPLRRAAVVLRPGRRPGRLGSRHGPADAGRGRLRRPAPAGPGARGRRARPGRGVGVTTLDPAA